MKFAVITHVKHQFAENRYFGYAPYVREMNMWFKHVDQVKVVAPLQQKKPSALESHYKHAKLSFAEVPGFSLVSSKEILATLVNLPGLIFQILKAMYWADHIHLRCPGNMGLLGCILQIFFPSKPKTAKYAGNWDPKSKQPWSYRLQKWILANTFLTKNMKVLVYGNWPNQSTNILPFFTASFSEIERIKAEKDFSRTINFIFVGSLVEGKQPLLAIKIVEALYKLGFSIHLKLYGEGALKEQLQDYIEKNKIDYFTELCGGVSLKELKKVYQKAHFSILLSKSEGWPKAVAEAMFYGCIPIASRVSCVPWMLNKGERGILLSGDMNLDIPQIQKIIEDPEHCEVLSKNAAAWSQQYTLEGFEAEIKKLL